MEKWLIGRELLYQELNSAIENIESVQERTGFTKNAKEIICNRCGADRLEDRFNAPCFCGRDCFYCVRCLQMGKVKKCSVLYYQEEENSFDDLEEPIMTWTGDLSLQQQQASGEIVNAIRNGEERLIWAVAGAGKTEMLFQGIADALKDKKRICLASPRVDVCLELAPRLQQAFSQVDIAVLHGTMEEPYTYTQLVITTTHQLMRFREAFDVLIIDEIDAFPFHIDESLQFAAQKARKKNGALIYLSATPNRDMRKAVRANQLAASILPARYHGFSLPVPKFIWAGDWRKGIANHKKRGAFLDHVKRLLAKKRRLLIFVPHIALMQQLDGFLRELFPECSFTSVHAEDPERKEKVLRMRQEQFDFLLTTTILIAVEVTLKSKMNFYVIIFNNDVVNKCVNNATLFFKF
ncbi:DEAD/DEAH box helicase family protein [Desemzia sp. RIT804]|uniref:DEAD/DEAH box helicase n=1 Tax=Desemzia sp. RIT 804 TaxID=2810209 RepID=UPI0019515B95|nr:DEAD/DEAH box helicase family protein [Desemzia sp. RIT 804]MBM6615587.1 DEAD/DEAH box helicase family protein [Desemzia sp. RIT 804]